MEKFDEVENDDKHDKLALVKFIELIKKIDPKRNEEKSELLD